MSHVDSHGSLAAGGGRWTTAHRSRSGSNDASAPVIHRSGPPSTPASPGARFAAPRLVFALALLSAGCASPVLAGSPVPAVPPPVLPAFRAPAPTAAS